MTPRRRRSPTTSTRSADSAHAAPYAAHVPSPTIRALSRLGDGEATAVLGLVRAVTTVDRMSPLSEHVLLHLRQGGDEADVHYIADMQGALAGYAHLDATDVVAGPIVELAVHPMFRRMGVGRALVQRVLEDHPGRMRLWAHGENAGANELAGSLGFTRARTLWQMRRSLLAPLDDVALPHGVNLRSFLPGLDDEAWLALNAKAFASLPDQGSWTQADLDARTAEPWFDPSGFLVAEDARTGAMVGFHWTKVHGGDPAHEHEHGAPDEHPHELADGHSHDAIGEVYVIGVDPSWSGRGLGRALTVAGLHHLRALGLDSVMLYVDSSNTNAIGLYESLGFARWDTDVLYRA